MKALLVKPDDLDASLRRVQDLAADEERMTITEVLVSTHELSAHLHEGAITSLRQHVG